MVNQLLNVARELIKSGFFSTTTHFDINLTAVCLFLEPEKEIFALPMNSNDALMRFL